MTSSLSTARPPSAAIAWATPDALFVEIPCKNGGPPYIIREKLTIQGLAAALNVLIKNNDPMPRVVDQSAHPAVKVIKPEVTAKARAPWADDKQREDTRKVLRKMGLI